MVKDTNPLVGKYLSTNKRWYWKDPEHARTLQRAKYKRYPEKIYAIARSWQKKNREHWNMLVKFGNQIHKAKVSGDIMLERQLRAAREEYKRMHREKVAAIKQS